MSRLPDAEELRVALDTETSGLFVDDGSRVAVVSFAYREPVKRDGRWVQKPDAPIVSKALAFDQGVTGLPLGDKDIPSRHLKRLNRVKPITAWIDGRQHDDIVPKEWFYRPAPNLAPKWWDQLIEWLGRQRLDYHNGKFDMQQIRAGLRGCGPGKGGAAAFRSVGLGVDLEPAFGWDTQLGQRILEPEHPTGLKPTGERLHLGKDHGFAEGGEADEQRALAPWRGAMTGKDADPRYDLIPWEVIGGYAATDALMTLLLGERQRRMVAEDYQVWQRHLDDQFDLMIALYRMENRGIGFDSEGCLVERDKIEVNRQKVAAELPFDPTPDKARRYFFNEPTEEPPGLGVIPRSDKMTEGGKPQVDEEVINALTHHGDPRVERVARQYQRHETMKSAIAKWYGAWPDRVGPDGRLRTSYRQAHVVSGRLSAERIQLQAIPRDYRLADLGPEITSIREFFVPEGAPGLINWELDVANAEPRIATMVARCGPMYEGIMVEGRDTHSVATLLMFGETIQPDEEGRPFGPDHRSWDEYRQVGKRSNLGILYAAGPGAIRDTIRKEVGVEYEISQVRHWVDLYRSAFPQFVNATEWWANHVDQFGFIRTVTNRVRAYASYEPYHSGFNQVIQGSVADAMTRAMIDIEYHIPGAMLLQVHDSLVLQLPADQAGIEQLALAATIIRVTFERMFALRWVRGGPRRHMDFPVDVKTFGRVPEPYQPKELVAQAEAAIADRYQQFRQRHPLRGVVEAA